MEKEEIIIMIGVWNFKENIFLEVGGMDMEKHIVFQVNILMETIGMEEEKAIVILSLTLMNIK